jgi:hypothetical protein
MKKFTLLAVAALLVVAMSVPAVALENILGGYWRTRWIDQSNFAGEDAKHVGADLNWIDTRTRLFYTAKFSDKLRFVNQFEMNAVWGGAQTYGQLGADGANFLVKRSYIDLKTDPFHFEIGIQNFQFVRGYIFDDDAAGVKAIYKLTDGIYLPLIFLKSYEGGSGKFVGVDGQLKSADEFDVNGWVFYPTIFLNRTTTLKPHVAWLYSDDYSKAYTQKYSEDYTSQVDYYFSHKLPGAQKLNAWTTGLEFDTKMDAYTLFATGVMEFGSVDISPFYRKYYYNHDSLDFKGYLFDLGGSYNAGPTTLRLKGIYASGNDQDSIKKGNMDAFFNPGTEFTGASYPWAEIMGFGKFDTRGPATADDPTGSLSDKITNRIIGNLGMDFRLLPSLKLAADLWYAKAAEDIKLANGQYGDKLGTELDLVLTYNILENLNLDLVGAYLWADDVITKATTINDCNNPYEFGAQLSLAF